MSDTGNDKNSPSPTQADSARYRQLLADDRRYVWHPFTQSTEWNSYEPIIVDKAEGFELIDVEGRRYVDAVSSIWCNVHGHGHPKIVAAMKEQLDRVAHSTMLGLSHAPAVELARRLVELTPQALTRVFFSDAGSTSVEVALRMAFQYWRQVGQPQRDRFVTLTDAYHGDTIGSVSLGFSEPFHRGYEALTFRTLKFDPPFLCDPINGIERAEGDALEQASMASLRKLEMLLDEHGANVAAVFIEPLVQGAAGIWPQTPHFLREVRRLCDEAGCLMVCDEVATGFGRTGTLLAVDQAEVSPDILCLAKGLTAGYLPLAATLATETIYAAFEGTYSSYRALFHGHTYGGNPLGCAAALANLDVFDSEDTLAKAKSHGEELGRLLDQFIEPLAHTGPVRRVGMMVGFDILEDPSSGRHFAPDQRRSHHAVLAARERGVIIRPLGDTMILMPPLTMPPDLLKHVVEVTAVAIDEATAK
jgi:adenosylmethionine-8-amino-7-oxononanoate aminotransferase